MQNSLFTPSRRIAQSYRMKMIHAVLESALDVENDEVVAMCRGLIAANTIGFRAHANKAHLAFVREIYVALTE